MNQIIVVEIFELLFNEINSQKKFLESMKMSNFCKTSSFSSLLILLLLMILLGLCYLFSYLLVTLGLDGQTSAFSGQMMFVVFFLLLGTVVKVCNANHDCQDDIETGTNVTNEFTETEIDPPAYDDVLDDEEKTCPSYNQAVEMNIL